MTKDQLAAIAAFMDAVYKAQRGTGVYLNGNIRLVDSGIDDHGVLSCDDEGELSWTER